MQLTKGTRIWYHGDQANAEGFGTIIDIEAATYYGPETAIIEMDDGRQMTISTMAFHEKYEGHGGTRFTTAEAYEAHYQEEIARMKRDLEALGYKQKDAGVKDTIDYAGKNLHLRHEVDTIDEAQSLLDGYRIRGLTAACLHQNGKHQLYAEPQGK